MEKNHGDDHSYTRQRLKELRVIHKREVTSSSDAAKNLRDEARVFQDVLPGYKIKELTEEEKGQMRSKDVRNLQDVEQTILFYYRKFLGNLVGLAHKRNEEAQYVALNCLCDMLPYAQDFNYGSSVIDTIVNHASSKSPRLSSMCVQAIRDLLSAPTPTDAVLSCLQCISDQVKERGPLVSHRLLSSLMCVRIKIMDVFARDLSKEKQQKKRMKDEDKELAKMMEKGAAKLSRVEIAKLQTTMLNKIITTYLRTLEVCRTAPRYRQSLLLQPTMEGLAKYAHMIDFSLFETLLQAIRDVLESDYITTAAAINGIITVSELANSTQRDSSSSENITVDIAPYYEHLYAAIPHALDTSAHHDDTSRVDKEQNFDEKGRLTDDATSAVSMVAPRGRKSDPPRNTLRERTERARLVLKACDLMLLAPKKVSMQRVAAFFRRLELCAAHCPPHVSLSIFAFCRRLLQKYSGLSVLHDGGEEAAGGAYDPSCDQPDHVNAMTCVSWDLTLARRSFHPTVREYAATLLRQHRGVSTNAQKAATLSSTLMGITFETALKVYDTSNGGFSPLPQDVNKKMDRSTLKRRQDAVIAMEREQQLERMMHREKEAAAAPEAKRRRVAPAALEGA